MRVLFLNCCVFDSLLKGCGGGGAGGSGETGLGTGFVGWMDFF